MSTTTLRLTLRALIRDRTFSITAVVALSLGIGATTAVLSLADRALLKPLPFPRSERLVKVWETQPSSGVERMWVSPLNAEDWRSADVFKELATVQPGYDVNLGLGGTPERAEASRVSKEFFDVMAVVSAVGRGFLVDGAEDNLDTVVLSHGLWQRRFAGDPRIVGTSIRVDDRRTTVVGVMPEDFDFPPGTELWLPLKVEPDRWPRTAHFLEVVARLPPGTGLAVAQAKLSAFVHRLATRHPEIAGWDVRLVPLREELIGDVRPVLFILLGTVSLVLLLTSANAGSLFLARVVFRQDELAVRAALGAGRTRITLERILDSVVLVAAAAVLGIALALVTTPLLLSWAPEVLAPFRLRLDLRLWVTAGLVSFLTIILFATWPVLRASRVQVQWVMQGARRTQSAGRRSRCWQDGLIVFNVALSLVLMVGAGLFLKSMLKLSAVDAGFDPFGVVTAELALPATTYPDETRAAAFFAELHSRLAVLPRVSAVGLTTALPTTNSTGGTVLLSREGYESGRKPMEVQFVAVSPDYFDSLGIELLAGRDFSARDRSDTSPVAVVSRSLVRQMWSTPDIVGKELYLGLGRDVWYEVVGVVEDVRETSLLAPPQPAVYLPLTQHTSSRHIWLTLRSEADATSIVPAARHVVRDLDPHLPLYDVQPMSASVAESVGREHFLTRLIGLLALLTLVVGSVGIYGSVAYTVAQRIGEIGIRLTLGARPKQVIWEVVRRELLLAILGVGLGLVASWHLTRLLEAFLYEVGVRDMTIFSIVTAVFLSVALLASYLPARRVAQVDPKRSLQAV